MNSLIQESKFLKKKLKSLEIKNQKSEKISQEQEQFYNILLERYQNLCQEIGEDPKVTVDVDNKTGLYSFEIKREKMPALPQKKIKNVSQYWKEDNPDHFQVVDNPKQFEKLLKKVKTLRKSNAIMRKQKAKIETKHSRNLQKIEQEKQKLGKYSKNIIF